MNTREILQAIGQPIVDYNQLQGALKDYAHPRKKIAKLIHTGDLIQVKKGLYLFNKSLSPPGYAVETLANLLYGPSYISLKYALAYYGLIPERVVTITSVTSKRDKEFMTPVGKFTYRLLNIKAYHIGVNRQEFNNQGYLIASLEKALCDFIALDKYVPNIKSINELCEFMFEDMRFYENIIAKIDKIELYNVASFYKNRKLKNFVNYFLQWRPNE